MDIRAIGAASKAASRIIGTSSNETRNAALRAIAAALEARKAEIFAANEADLAAARENGMSAAMLDRLAARITSEVPGINRVLFDYTPKPPATVEYE